VKTPHTLTQHSLRLLLIATFVFTTFAIWNTPLDTHSTASAQDDSTARTPDEWCADAQEDIAEPETRQFEQAEEVLEQDVDYQAIFCTEKGAIYVDLFERYTPVTVNNFVFLAQNGFYNNSDFHRVIAEFMVQGGDPVGEPAGTGGPGYQFQDEFLPFLAFNQPGWLAMANAGPGTNGSQFFITRVPTTHLNARHTIFGQVLEGQTVVNDITDTESGTPEPDQLHTVLIITDPASVDSSYVPPEAATADEVQTTITDIFAEDPTLTQIEGEVLEAEAAAARFESEEAQAIASDLYEEFGFSFRAGGTWQLAECPEEPDLLGLSYYMTEWESEQSAAAFANDPALVELQQAQGFTELDDTQNALSTVGFPTDLLFNSETSEICDTAATRTRYVWNRGRYTMQFELTIAEGAVPADELPVAMANVGFNITNFVGDIILSGGQPSLGFE
jgi:peptidylprolyl isomerase